MVVLGLIFCLMLGVAAALLAGRRWGWFVGMVGAAAGFLVGQAIIGLGSVAIFYVIPQMIEPIAPLGDAPLRCGSRPRISDARNLGIDDALEAALGPVEDHRVRWLAGGAEHRALRSLLALGDEPEPPVVSEAIWVGPLRVEGEDARVLVVATRADADKTAVNALGLLVFGLDGGWCLVEQSLALTTAGPWDIPPVPHRIALNETHEAILYQISAEDQGFNVMQARLLGVIGGRARLLLDAPLSENNAGACGESTPCWGYESELAVVPGDRIHPDITLSSAGRHMPGGHSFEGVRTYVFTGDRFEGPPQAGPSGGGDPVSEKRLIMTPSGCAIREIRGDGGHTVELPPAVANALQCGASTTALGPDGRLLVYVTEAGPVAFDFGAQALTPLPVAGWQWRPAVAELIFSPDGRRFALVWPLGSDEREARAPATARVAIYDVVDGEVRQAKSVLIPLGMRCEDGGGCRIEAGVDIRFADRELMVFEQVGSAEPGLLLL